ncbi:MAG: hypothetical protein ACOH2M_04580 [Cypionkella sp.]
MLIERPKLTMPEAEAQLLQLAYADAGVILEYGSGGSTVVAAEAAGKRVFSVESDPDWLAMMQGYFADNPPLADLTMLLGDIGPTKAWSFPKDETKIRDWPKYPLAVWDLDGFVHPDVILIDGRFRAACFLTALFKITKPTLVLWDDYKERPAYHEVEVLVKPAEMVGRMAIFELSPMAVPPERLLWVIQTFLLAR